MLVQEPPGTPVSLFPHPITVVKSFTLIGPDSPYSTAFSSLDHEAPLVFVSPSDDEQCPGCCKSFSAFSRNHNHPLSPAAASLVANKTVVFRIKDLAFCTPDIRATSGVEVLYLALVAGGAKAIIMVDYSKEPGELANLAGTFSYSGDRLAARGSSVPFGTVGSEAGERLIKAMKLYSSQKNHSSSAPASSSSSNVHITFLYDENAFLHFYKTYIDVPFKFVSFLTVALILHRCYCLGLRRSSSSGLPLLTSRNLVVIMAIPVAVAIITMVSFNGLACFDEESKGSIFFIAGTMLPFSNLSSSFLVARFWVSRNTGTTSVVADDPARTQPVMTLLVIVVGIICDITAAAVSIFLGRQKLASVGFFIALGYLLSSFYFFNSGIQHLRSLSTSSKPLKAMAFYLILVGAFTFMIILSTVSVGAGMFKESVGAYFATSLFFCK